MIVQSVNDALGGDRKHTASRIVAALVKKIGELEEAIQLGIVSKSRYLTLADAARYCGFVDPDRPDPKYRAFKAFAEAEEISYKEGNPGGKFEYLFDRYDLDEAMKRNRRVFAA